MRRATCDFNHSNNHKQTDAEKLIKFWGDIWNESVDHNWDTKWLKDIQSEVNVTKQEKVHITKESLKKIFGRMQCQNWKPPGPDLAHGFWLKKF